MRGSLPYARLLVAAVVWSCLGCTEAGLQPIVEEKKEQVDDLLTLEGQVCTAAPGEVNFPVKIMLIVDGSGSMQFTDPSDTNTTKVMNGRTPTFDANAVQSCINTCQSAKPAPTNCSALCGPKQNPGRQGAVQALVDRFKTNPSVSFNIIRFNGRITVNGSAVSQGVGEFTNDESVLNKAIASLAQADITTDYQGALTAAYQVLEKDMAATSPVDRARTKYVIIFLSDGAPYPVCKEGCGNDEQDLGGGIVVDSWCDVPRGKWCENFYVDDNEANCEDMTNWYPLMVEPCREYNSELEVKKRVMEIMALGDQYSVGEIRMHTAFLFVPSLPPAIQKLMAVEGSSNQECTKDSDCPAGVVTAEPERCVDTGLATKLCKGKSERLLIEMAKWGDGLFRNFSSGQQIDFLAFNYSSVARPFGMTNFMVTNLNSLPDFTKLLPDSDGDGVSDQAEFAADKKMSNAKADSDKDGYGDKLEYDRLAAGFDPGDATKPQSLCAEGNRTDDDGDGLNACEEKVLGTDPRIADTDRDRIPDGIEFVWGTNPLAADDKLDVDFDGKLSGEEIRIHANPSRADPTILGEYRYIYDVREQQPGPDQRRCYDFTVRRLRLVPTDLRAGPGSMGYNDILLYFGEGPADDPRDYGKFKAACVRAQYVPPDYKDPADGRVKLTDADFQDLPALLAARAAAEQAAAAGAPITDPCHGAALPSE